MSKNIFTSFSMSALVAAVLLTSACSGKISNSGSSPSAPSNSAGANENPERPLLLQITKDKNLIYNQFTLSTNQKEYIVVFEIEKADESMSLAISNFVESTTGNCNPYQISSTMSWNKFDSDGNIIDSMPIYSATVFKTEKGFGYDLIIKVKNPDVCKSYEQNFVVKKQ